MKWVKCICGNKLAKVKEDGNVKGLLLKCRDCKREVEVIYNEKSQRPEARVLEGPESRVQSRLVRTG